MTTLRFAELFAGAGGMSLGLERAGMACSFHAEIADFPRRVLTHRFPDVPLYGDVTTLNGAELTAKHGVIDLLAGGSPCQDLSVAGKRKGMTEGSGTRSSLFYEQLRLWEETNAQYLLWENVAGALSSNGGADVAAVLSAIVGATVAVPRDGWGGDESGGGVAAGPRAVAAWRLLDAQWFGVPQRRLRVFVLGARAGGCDPAQVLLEPEGVYRNPPTRGETRERAAAGAAFGALGPSSVADPISASEGKTYTHEGENNFRLHNVVSFQPNAGKNAHGQAIFENVTPTIGGAGGGNMPAVLAFDTHVQATAGTPRRLMPIECERLMSWPDDFTNVPDEKGKPASDSVRYKAIGNGVVSNVAEWIARRLIAVHDAMGEP